MQDLNCNKGATVASQINVNDKKSKVLIFELRIKSN
jgi:hypothetical protein